MEERELIKAVLGGDIAAERELYDRNVDRVYRLAHRISGDAGQAHNPFKSGEKQTWYGIGRFGKEFNEGNHRVNLMGTAVLRDEERTLADNRPWAQRDAYSGGMHFVFAELDRQVYDMTLRSSLLFSKDQSLEVYLQPFLAVGSYGKPVELMTPGELDYSSYAAAGFDVSNEDFSFAAVNLNLVYRWEYRPGSTFYLVWAHSRQQYDARAFHSEPGTFDNSFSLGSLFNNEPENTFLAKFSYWFAI